MVMMCVRNGEEVQKDIKEEKDRKRVQDEGDEEKTECKEDIRIRSEREKSRR